MKKLIATVTAAGLLSLGGAGVAAAQDNGGGAGNGTTTSQPAHQPGRHQRVRHQALRAAIEAAASTIGVQPRELIQDVRGGQTVAQVAQSKGVDPQDVVNAIVKALDDKIDQAVKDGKIDDTRAAKLKDRVPTLADKLVNNLPKRVRGQGATPSS